MPTAIRCACSYRPGVAAGRSPYSYDAVSAVRPPPGLPGLPGREGVGSVSGPPDTDAERPVVGRPRRACRSSQLPVGGQGFTVGGKPARQGPAGPRSVVTPHVQEEKVSVICLDCQSLDRLSVAAVGACRDCGAGSCIEHGWLSYRAGRPAGPAGPAQPSRRALLCGFCADGRHGALRVGAPGAAMLRS